MQPTDHGLTPSFEELRTDITNTRFEQVTTGEDEDISELVPAKRFLLPQHYQELHRELGGYQRYSRNIPKPHWCDWTPLCSSCSTFLFQRKLIVLVGNREEHTWRIKSIIQMTSLLRGALGMWEAGVKIKDISQVLGVSKVTMQRWFTRWQNDGNVKTKSRTGKPRVTTPEEDIRIVAAAQESSKVTAVDITRNLHLAPQHDTPASSLDQGELPRPCAEGDADSCS
ncbi:hypothetical protein GWK47_034901 [Chionoecetes opilio]|uniref:Uncharacterized protein n=1 Tax=Chionoecetes opilio TaxID=41210 RepID=A0A8J4YHC7_CHIOP|nr:hypothetical protein GWK47_034901 [Chionoecetes opilio]